ncbi:DUF4261 domain-containing protein [Bremerella cremea]|uniref:DUF4261 domain-containing protein n=2 Tax=Bremerella cremea TaxID=1031537 RepID=A0A368KS32_9BACT|nr:DUF4261 domain-containing protein [Bremerella cremea]
MIALNRGSRVSWKSLRNDLATFWPMLPAPEEARKQENTLSFDIGNMSIAMGMMPGPIPGDNWATPQRQTWIWPDAVEQMQSHRGHLIVTAVGEAAVLEQSKLLTMVTASLLRTVGNPAGVLWGENGLLNSPEMFCALAETMLPSEMPFPLWLSVFVGKNSDGTTVGFTQGMEAFDLMDFVTENATDSPDDLSERFYGLAGYLAEHGPVIEDGHTIGEDVGEHIQVRYCQSPFGHQRPVMRLDFFPETGRSRYGSWR